VATLRASEATIYERYGYGVASSSQTVEVRTARATLRPDVGAGGPVRLLDAAEAWDVLPGIYARNRPSRPGTIDRPEVWWQGLRMRTESFPGPSYVAVHGEPGSESGFARYRPVDTESWFISDQRTIAVEDFFAPTTDAYVGLLRFLLGLDLIDRVVFWMLPVDDPLPWLLVDRRAARVTAVHDETWLRVVDARKALAAREYVGDGTVTIAVNDPLLPENSASFTVTADGAEPTDRRAQLHTVVEGLGAVLLGGGAKGKRAALPNARILIHQASAGVQGTAADIEVHAREILRLNARLKELMASDMGQDIDRISRDINRDYWMSAQEALDYRVIDIIHGQTAASEAADRAEAAVESADEATVGSADGKR